MTPFFKNVQVTLLSAAVSFLEQKDYALIQINFNYLLSKIY
jgi:hypothetical protein